MGCAAKPLAFRALRELLAMLVGVFLFGQMQVQVPPSGFPFLHWQLPNQTLGIHAGLGGLEVYSTATRYVICLEDMERRDTGTCVPLQVTEVSYGRTTAILITADVPA